MTTKVIPFARMSRKVQREHLQLAHGITKQDLKDFGLSLHEAHTRDHRDYDYVSDDSRPAGFHPHEHTKA